jgi:hypothetical protein
MKKRKPLFVLNIDRISWLINWFILTPIKLYKLIRAKLYDFR